MYVYILFGSLPYDNTVVRPMHGNAMDRVSWMCRCSKLSRIYFWQMCRGNTVILSGGKSQPPSQRLACTCGALAAGASRSIKCFVSRVQNVNSFTIKETQVDFFPCSYEPSNNFSCRSSCFLPRWNQQQAWTCD